jgi:hypothetical protein
MATRQKAMHFDGPPVESETLDVNQFLFVNGRLPRIDDPVPPWKYRGWMLYYVQTAEMALRGEASRWAYMMEILETGELPDRPIPKLEFGGPDSRVYNRLEKWSELNGYDLGGWHDFETLLDWFLWGLALWKEEPKYHRADAARRLYTEVNLEDMLKHPYDYFGAYISEHKAKNWNKSGFFPTPHTVCECMVQMMFHDEGEDSRHLTVNEPCVGTGRMLLHAAQFSLRLSGQDIDPVPLACCKINGALYAPWLSYPLPDSVFAKEDWLKAISSVPVDDSPATPIGRHQPSLFDRTIGEVEVLN